MEDSGQQLAGAVRGHWDVEHRLHYVRDVTWDEDRSQIRAAGLRWPVEECFEFSKDDFGLDQCRARLYTAIVRYTVLVMPARAICAVAAAHLRRRTDTQAPACATTCQRLISMTGGMPAD